MYFGQLGFRDRSAKIELIPTIASPGWTFTWSSQPQHGTDHFLKERSKGLLLNSMFVWGVFLALRSPVWRALLCSHNLIPACITTTFCGTVSPKTPRNASCVCVLTCRHAWRNHAVPACIQCGCACLVSPKPCADYETTDHM